MTPDPYAPHLRQAEKLFAQLEYVKAGQIWQAILKQNPSHAEARTGLLAVKERLLALREAESQEPVLSPSPTSEPAADPEPDPPVPPVVDPRSTAPEAPQPADPGRVITGSLDSDHLLAVRERIHAHRDAESQEPALSPSPTSEPAAAPELDPPVPPVVDPRSTAPEAPQPLDPGRVITGSLDPDRLLAEGCTLYDMGQLGDALKKWEQVLALDPGHALARSYANGARRELDLPLLETASSAAPTEAAAHLGDEDMEKLLREAVQLYDMGLVAEAITKWERVLALEPGRQDIEGYLKQARKEVGVEAPGPLPAPTGHTAFDPEALDLKLRQAEHLLSLQRQEEAAFTFQQALGLDPGNARALHGLERCLKPSSPASTGTDPRQSRAQGLDLDTQGRIAMAEEDARFTTGPEGVEPPATLTKSAPAPRTGLSLPDRFREAAEKAPWLKDPKIMAGVGGGVLFLAVSLGLVHSYHKDQALKEEVRSARAAAVAPVAQQAQAPDLAEAPTAIRQEAETALTTDPLRAYLRAETLVARNPGDAASAQLLEKARAGLREGGITGASLAEFQKHLQNGDLETALKVIDSLLRARPDDADLRTKAGRLNLTLCFAHASQAKWEEAQEDLVRGRALFPGDKGWQARLRLLEQVKAMPKAQQPSWIPLLS